MIGEAIRSAGHGNRSSSCSASVGQPMESTAPLCLSGSDDDNHDDDDDDSVSSASENDSEADDDDGNFAGRGADNVPAGPAGSGSSQPTAKAAAKLPDVPRFLVNWKIAFDLTDRSLCDRLERNKDTCGANDEVSLVMSLDALANGDDNGTDIGDDVAARPKMFFAKWTNVPNFEGRIVRIDGDNRVVFSPATLFGKPAPSEPFRQPHFLNLVGNCGAASRKYRGHKGVLRDQLPSDVVRFARVTGTLIGRLSQVAGLAFLTYCNCLTTDD